MMQRFANSPYWSGSRELAAKGLWPNQAEIPKGAILYRFIDIGRSPPALAADGPWWFEYESFQRIKHFGLQHGYPLGYCARLFGSVLYEWSNVNAVLRAEVSTGPLLAWKGRGKQVTATGKDARDVSTPHGVITGNGLSVAKMTPMQGPNEVLQLFIPGLGEPHRKFASLMKLLNAEQIPTG